MAGTAVFRIVVSSDSMKNATATSHGRKRFPDSSADGGEAVFGAEAGSTGGAGVIGCHGPSGHPLGHHSQECADAPRECDERRIGVGAGSIQELFLSAEPIHFRRAFGTAALLPVPVGQGFDPTQTQPTDS